MILSYGKIAIYVLTFLGYVYSGYGSGILANLRDAFVAAETVFGDVLKNAVYVLQKFRKMHDVFDAAVDEQCIYNCPGDTKPQPMRGHVPTSDGCGSLGLNIDSQYLPVGQMEQCCHQHDICYDTCNKAKETCDVQFQRCLFKYCENLTEKKSASAFIKACKAAAKMLFTGTLTLGCRSYKDAQSKACYCPPSYGWKIPKQEHHQRHEEL